jgi:hypothetical protein
MIRLAFGCKQRGRDDPTVQGEQHAQRCSWPIQAASRVRRVGGSACRWLWLPCCICGSDSDRCCPWIAAALVINLTPSATPMNDRVVGYRSAAMAVWSRSRNGTCAAFSLRRASLSSNHSTRSISGKVSTRPDRGGHSIS